MFGKLSIRLLFVFLSIFLLSSCHNHRHRGDNRQDRESGVNVDNVRTSDSSGERRSRQRTPVASRSRRGKSVIPMTFENGVYYIMAEINGVPMKFVFDTGASIISLSLVEAEFLYKQGTLKDEDFKGTLQFCDANGYVSDGAVVLLRTVKLGDLVLNDVEASIVMNQQAPLLFGQTALMQFGKITIDNKNNRLIIE